MRPGRIVVIGEPDAVFGLGLVGLEGQAVAGLAEAHKTLALTLRDPSVALVLLTEDWAEALQDVVDEAAITMAGPMVVEIPASRPVERSKGLFERIEQTLGIRLGD